MAENLHELGIQVTVVEMADQVMTPVDFEIAAVVHQQFKDRKVGLLLQEAVAAFCKTENGLQVELKSGKTLQADWSYCLSACVPITVWLKRPD